MSTQQPQPAPAPDSPTILRGAVHVRLQGEAAITVNDDGRITRIPLSQREVRAIVESAFLLGLRGVAS